MPNIASVLKSEIARIARREVRAETERLKQASVAYRAQIRDLREQMAALERQVAQLTKANGTSRSVAVPAEAGSVRFSPLKLRRHRERLDLSAAKFGKLFGVSAQTVYNWEAGTRPDKNHLMMISQLRRLTKRQAQAVVNGDA
jgi:DNA-binding transcriptional regulator YiaG